MTFLKSAAATLLSTAFMAGPATGQTSAEVDTRPVNVPQGPVIVIAESEHFCMNPGLKGVEKTCIQSSVIERDVTESSVVDGQPILRRSRGLFAVASSCVVTKGHTACTQTETRLQNLKLQ